MNKILYCKNTPDLSGQIVRLDGKELPSSESFFISIWEQLSFPESKYKNWNAYLDWIRDLSWLDKKSISIVITNFDSFLNEEPDKKKHFLSDFRQVVFPFWKNNAKNIYNNENEIKSINIYIITEETKTIDCLPVKEVVSNVKRDILEGRKTPHTVSLPVFTIYDGKLCFAFFNCYYNRQDLDNNLVNSPSLYAIADIKTGEIVHRYHTTRNENSKCSLALETQSSPSEAYYNKLYELLELIRKEFIETGIFNYNLYNQYFSLLLAFAPIELRSFYVDSSL